MQDAAPLLMLLGALVLFWLLIVRPARGQQRRMAELQESLKVGDRVVIGAGIFGTITALHDATIDLEVAPGTVISVARQVVVRTVEADSSYDEAATPDAVTPPTTTPTETES